MIGQDDVILFKDELKSYKRLNIKRLRLKAEIEKVIYDMENVKAIKYDKETSGGSNNSNIIIDLLPKKEQLEEELAITESRIAYVDKVLKLMSPHDKNMLVNIYINGISYEQMALQEHYSEIGLKKKVNSIIKSILSIL